MASNPRRAPHNTREILQVNVKTAYFEAGAFEENAFDVVRLDNALEHIPAPEQCFAQPCDC